MRVRCPASWLHAARALSRRRAAASDDDGVPREIAVPGAPSGGTMAVLGAAIGFGMEALNGAFRGIRTDGSVRQALIGGATAASGCL